MPKKLPLLFTWLALAALPFVSKAHAPGQSYIYLRILQTGVDGSIQLTTEDLNAVLGLNLKPDLSMVDVEPHISRIQAYILDKVAISAAGKDYQIRFTETSLLPLDIGTFVISHFTLDGMGDIPDALDITNNLMFDQNDSHRSMLLQEYNWKAGIINNESLISLVFSPDDNRQRLSLTEGSVWQGFWAMVKLGIWHIWIGIDHILFLLALILPSVVRRREAGEEISDTYPSSLWAPVDRFRPAFIYIVKIVTFFTIAHSVTLSMAALGLVNLPSRLVESIIALSIALAAFHNIKPVLPGKEWLIALVFGLFHGFGFASVLAEKGLSGEYMVLSLFGFNLGVEIGQVVIICLIFPILFLIRRWRFYPKFLTYGSMVLIFISFYWGIERMFEVDLPAGAYFRKFLHFIGLR